MHCSQGHVHQLWVSTCKRSGRREAMAAGAAWDSVPSAKTAFLQTIQDEAMSGTLAAGAACVANRYGRLP